MSGTSSLNVDWLQVSVTAGVVLLLFGLQLRTVEAFVCSPEATQVLADWTGPDEQTAQGAFQRMLVQKTDHRHVIEPPAWLGWAALSIGFVLTAHRLWGKWLR